MQATITFLAWSSLILALISYVRGTIAIMYGPAQPSIISRFFWLALSITNLLSYFSLNAGAGIFIALAVSIGSLIIFLLSLRYGYIEFKRSDIFTIIGACVAFLCYILINAKEIALIAGLLTHFIGGIPTYKKIWWHPSSEDFSFWALFGIASACSLLGVIIQNKNIIYPLYLFVFDTGIVILILLGRARANRMIPQGLYGAKP